MKSVTFVDWFCDPRRPGASGLSDLVWAMAPRLQRADWTVRVVGPYEPPPDANRGEVSVIRQATPWPAYRNIVGHLVLATVAARDARRRDGPGIIHTVEYLSTAVTSVVAPRRPVVLTTPGNIFEREESVNHFDRTATLAYKVAALVAARRAAHVVATSQEMRFWWRRSGAIPSKLTVIPLGVDTDQFKPRPNARGTLAIDPNEAAILFVGRLQSENGAAQLVRALPEILAAHPRARLHVVGDGEERAALVSLSRRLGVWDRIQWHGAVPLAALPRMYAAANVCVVPRRSRVTPRVLLEAMACGTPVVASRIGGIVDFVVDGQTGLLVDPTEPPQLASAVSTLLSDPSLALRIGAAAREYARDVLDWDVVVRRLIDEVYTPLVERTESTGERVVDW